MYEKLSKHPDVQNVHPRFIAPVDGKMQEVGRDVDGVVYLTDAGRKLLGLDQEAEATGDKAGKHKGKAKAVELPGKVVESEQPTNPSAGDLEI